MVDQPVSIAGYCGTVASAPVAGLVARRKAIPRPANPGKAGVRTASVAVGGLSRQALLLTPRPRGSFAQQAAEILEELRTALDLGRPRPRVTLQTVFLKRQQDRAQCETLLRNFYGGDCPVTAYVAQAPCNGAALALEAWAVSGPGVAVERFGPQALAVTCDDVRWIYCSGIEVARGRQGVYAGSLTGMASLSRALAQAGSSFEHVVRTWFYLGGITRKVGSTECYREFNRARADFYSDIPFGRGLLRKAAASTYPASTGIGMRGTGLAASCIAVETRRPDAFLVRLENPNQIPAFQYHERYSPRSPCFSRGVALVLGDQITTWISGTASILNSESQHPGDAAAQTHQTIDNIQKLLAPENFQSHDVSGAATSLRDLAKIRVYIKRPQDFDRCRAVCEERFGKVPVIYAVADVCRPELLVEIEGVAFSRRAAV